MYFRRLFLTARLTKYLLLREFCSRKRKVILNTKLVKLYIRSGAYNKAIKYAEELFYDGERQDYYFVLLNLYIMNNKYEEMEQLEKEHNFSFQEGTTNLIRLIDDLNDNLYDVDKISFIKDYIVSKGGVPSFIQVTGKGKLLRGKSAQEKDLIANSHLYIANRNDWSKTNNPPSYIKQLYTEKYDNKFNELFSYTPPVIRATKVQLSDFENTLVSVRNGLRTTVNQPETVDRKVIFFGSSTTFSIGMSDEDTLVSQVQKQVNRAHDGIKLENHGVLGMNLLLAMNNLVQTDINPNDIVVFFDFDEFIII